MTIEITFVFTTVPWLYDLQRFFNRKLSIVQS